VLSATHQSLADRALAVVGANRPSLLDPQTTAYHYTNIRLDNLVYPVAAMGATSKLLAPDGLFVMSLAHGLEDVGSATRLNRFSMDAKCAPLARLPECAAAGGAPAMSRLAAF
jgi:hypothetical protein